ncbi:hypothetical protein [Flavobacterium sp. 245]|uniref:hypothetical protein n=1 Tax=Flavobacterium sp. 245 TaxID=2512115 RepID=UPI00105DBB09|nr:hypothetical protein [Flavobacterium sp. 245]
MKKSKQKNKKSHLKEYSKDYLKIGLVFFFILFVFREPLIYSTILSNFNVEYAKGYIIDEKNYERRGHLTDKFSYSYKFYYDNEEYFNVSNRKELKVGDSLMIEFNKYFPFMNRIVKSN